MKASILSHSVTVTHDRFNCTFAKSRRPHSGLTERSARACTCLSVRTSETAVNILICFFGDVQRSMFSRKFFKKNNRTSEVNSLRLPLSYQNLVYKPSSTFGGYYECRREPARSRPADSMLVLTIELTSQVFRLSPEIVLVESESLKESTL